MSLYAFIAVALLILLVIIPNIRIVPQSKAFIVERLGGYMCTWSVGLHVKIPFIDRIANRVSLKERVLDFKPQPVITKDNVTMMIDTVIYFQITDPKLFTYGVENPMNAIENLSATTLRNIIGELELDGTLTSRDVINTRMRSILDEATDPWGIKVNRVEVKNIIPPDSIQEAMEKQMRAEREKRATIAQSEGEMQARINLAEGAKAAAIAQSEGEKQAIINQAEGEAAQIRTVAQATAQGLRIVGEQLGNDSVAAAQLRLAESYIGEFGKLAREGNSLIIPADIADAAGMVAAVSRIIKPGQGLAAKEK